MSHVNTRYKTKPWIPIDDVTPWVVAEPLCEFRDGIHSWVYFYKDFDFRYDLCGCGWYRREARGMFRSEHPDHPEWEYAQGYVWEVVVTNAPTNARPGGAGGAGGEITP